MSLQYIIDGYNVIHHSSFAKTRKKNQDPKQALLELIRFNRLTGSLKNKITLVFDGYPAVSQEVESCGISIIFSRNLSADERIKKIIEASGDPKNMIVVSDDKEIKFFVKALGCRCLGVEEFTDPKVKKSSLKKPGLAKQDLSYSQIQRINQEFKKIWLEHEES